MQYRSFEPGIEVRGQNITAYLAAFKSFTTVPSALLVREGIGRLSQSGVIEIPPDSWFEMDAWLRVNERVHKTVGARILFDIGRHIISVAIFPPNISDIRSGLRSIDVAYHMNHRKNGKAMFDPVTGEMLEGIGHYGYQETPGKNEVVAVCRNPYGCPFDHGILTAMAQRFEPEAKVVHQSDVPCRDRGGESCTYVVTW